MGFGADDYDLSETNFDIGMKVGLSGLAALAVLTPVACCFRPIAKHLLYNHHAINFYQNSLCWAIGGLAAIVAVGSAGYFLNKWL